MTGRIGMTGRIRMIGFIGARTAIFGKQINDIFSMNRINSIFC